MSEYIYISKIIKNENTIEIEFECTEKIKKYFLTNKFFVTYDMNVEKIHDSIAIIPFLCNILPLLWITNTNFKASNLDFDFFKSINEFKKGYKNMYPNIEFHDIKVDAEKIKNDKINQSIATFFSGGIDAFATLFAHIKEKPYLITVWGADILLDDDIGWNNTKNNVIKTSEMFNLKYLFIKSNFKEMLNDIELNKLISNCPDKWWHGFQHGIGLIGLISPVAYILNIGKIYIASSYTKKDKVTCASHPSIDNYVRFCNTQIIHDQYEYNRQEKIEHIIQYTNKINKFPYIHVCWESKGGENCCICEKCCRTIMGIYAANGDAKKYGFENCNLKQIRNRMYFFNNIDPILIPIWNDIKEHYNKNKKDNIYNEEIKWLENFKPEKNRTIMKKICRKGKKIIERIKN